MRIVAVKTTEIFTMPGMASLAVEDRVVTRVLHQFRRLLRVTTPASRGHSGNLLISNIQRAMRAVTTETVGNGEMVTLLGIVALRTGRDRIDATRWMLLVTFDTS